MCGLRRKLEEVKPERIIQTMVIGFALRVEDESAALRPFKKS